MKVNSHVFDSLKRYTIRQGIIKNHYPWKYWTSNKNLFINITFWVWVCWFLMAISAIFLPVNNQQKLGTGAVIVFESTFTYIVRLLGNHRNILSDAENISPPFWNYEAYMFIYLTIMMVIVTSYCLYLIKQFLLDMNSIFKELKEIRLQLKIFVFLRFVKFFMISGILLIIWSSFALLYLKKPTNVEIGTILFKPLDATTQTTDKVYYRDLTFLGWLTSSLNIGYFCVSFLFYFKYLRELFLNNKFFFRQFRVHVESKEIVVLNDEMKVMLSENADALRKKQNFHENNTPGYIAELQGVNKYFLVNGGYFHALKDINLNIKNGEFIVILGYSGSGKTTLLNILAGIDRPSTGRCVIGDCNTSLMSDSNLNIFRRSKIGYIFQNYALLPNLTVQENIGITQNMDSLPVTEKFKNFKQKFNENEYLFEKIKIFLEFLKDVFLFKPNDLELKYLLETLDLINHKDKYPNQLSGGQQQRVSIARALIKKPSILLADEPTGAIDYAMTKSILNLFYQINEYAKTTVIVITHNPLIAKMAKRVLYVEEGKIIRDIINENPQRPSEIEGL